MLNTNTCSQQDPTTCRLNKMKAWRVTTVNHGGSLCLHRHTDLHRFNIRLSFYAFSQKHKSKKPERTSTNNLINIWGLNVFTWYSCGISEGGTLQVCWNHSNERAPSWNGFSPLHICCVKRFRDLEYKWETVKAQAYKERKYYMSICRPDQLHSGAGRSQNALFFR